MESNFKIIVGFMEYLIIYLLSCDHSELKLAACLLYTHSQIFKINFSLKL